MLGPSYIMGMRYDARVSPGREPREDRGMAIARISDRIHPSTLRYDYMTMIYVPKLLQRLLVRRV